MTTWTMDDAQAGDWQGAYQKLEQYWHEHRNNREFLNAIGVYNGDMYDRADTPRRVVILEDPDEAENVGLEPPRGILLATRVGVRSTAPYMVLVGGQCDARWPKCYGWWVPTIADFVPPVAPNLLARKRRRLAL